MLFEWCVGMYFPCISTVKSHVVPDRVSALADLARVEQSLAQATAMTACPYLYAKNVRKHGSMQEPLSTACTVFPRTLSPSVSCSA